MVGSRRDWAGCFCEMWIEYRVPELPFFGNAEFFVNAGAMPDIMAFGAKITLGFSENIWLVWMVGQSS